MQRTLGVLLVLAVAIGIGLVLKRRHDVATILNAAHAQAAKGAERRAWRFVASHDELSDVSYRTARAESEEGAAIAVTCAGSGALSILVVPEGAVYPHGGELYVRYRFDKQPPVGMVTWPASTGSVSVPDGEVRAFLAKMRGAKGLLIGVETAGKGLRQYRFGMDGLEAALPGVLSNCPQAG